MDLNTIGTLYPSLKELKPGESGTMFMHFTSGTAKSEGKEYELCTCANSGQMYVESKQTGRKYMLTWPELVELALARGLDGVEPIPNPQAQRTEKTAVMKALDKLTEKTEKKGKKNAKR